MEDVERANPQLVSSAVYGRTYEGRNITLLKVFNTDTRAGEYRTQCRLRFNTQCHVVSAVGTRKPRRQREEGHMGGLWHPCWGVDRSCLLPVVRQRGLYTVT